MMSRNGTLHTKITIIGGGPAGMTAAIFAAEKIGGEHVRLMEKNPQPGRKLLATGNGRCNITNRFSENVLGPMAPGILQQLDFSETLSFFKSIGILTREEAEGRVYPYSEQAASVLHGLESKLSALKVEILCGIAVQKLEKKKELFYIDAAGVKAGKPQKYSSEAVIIATGGKAGPQFGSTGDGFSFAKAFGHTIAAPFPSLTQITSGLGGMEALKGVRAKGSAALLRRSDVLAEEQGEIQFTGTGLSGICIFNLSRLIRLKGYGYGDYTVCLDLMPEFSFGELEELLLKRIDYLAAGHAMDFLSGIINEKLARFFLKGLLGAGKKTVSEAIGPLEVKRLAGLLKRWDIPVSGTKGWKEAQVTGGGVPMKELSGNTMESRLVGNLYFAGEVADFDGICGGYNLQWAWSSGCAAGKGAAAGLERPGSIEKRTK